MFCNFKRALYLCIFFISLEMAQAQAATLMKEISQKTASQQSGYCNVWVSFVEIYNENVYDLLQPNINPRPKLNLGEDKNGDVYVKGMLLCF